MDETEFGVCPVQLLFHQVYGQTVGPVNVSVHYHLPVVDRDTERRGQREEHLHLDVKGKQEMRSLLVIDTLPVAAIHASPLYPGLLPPVSPVHVPE